MSTTTGLRQFRENPTVATINGNQSQTVVETGTANHIVFTNNGGDTIDGRGASGNDLYFGGNGVDVLYAGTGNDYLDGNNGSDYLFGGALNAMHPNTTMLVGGNGGDLLVDGSAADVFLYRVTSDSSYVAGGPVAVNTTSVANELKTSLNAWDVIVNFNSSKDKIDLSLLDNQLTGSGPAKLVWYGAMGTDASAGQPNAALAHGVWIDQSGTFLYADVNGDGKADLKIQVSGVNGSDLNGVVAATLAPTITLVSDNVGSIQGTVANDGVTDDTTPTVRIGILGTGAVAGDTVQLYNGSTALGGPVTLLGTDVSHGYIEITPSALGEGSYAFNATVTDAGNTSSHSANYTITVDTTTPTGGTPDLTDASRFGHVAHGQPHQRQGPDVQRRARCDGRNRRQG